MNEDFVLASKIRPVASHWASEKLVSSAYPINSLSDAGSPEKQFRLSDYFVLKEHIHKVP